ncbi:acetate--CoA ligase family protein [Actinophytocola gossypii]|uniref:Acetate--CoA ligase family protein n=1 Tax=Actinophytocola gossypii TaxID=2812003 RepID=A0ABT2J317_9PSEU|nr:acetate--CoA ligase family protein [Actinophytocola gossypii]MCT2582253.1 acetate--CoA ligase family protein [Actinophytocola gossypii]
MSLDVFLNPRSVAVVGASAKEDSVGGRIIGQLATTFDGPVYPINPKYDDIRGLRTYPAVGAVGEKVDLVLAAAAARQIPAVLRDGAEAGARGAVVFSSGFAEVGGDGRALQDELRSAVRETGVRLLGPNCLGFVNFRRGMKATFTRIPFEMDGGNIAVLSQSGSMGIGTASLLRDDGANVSFWAATGNELDVSTGELAEELLGSADDVPDVIAVLVEGVENADAIMRAGRAAAAAGKQVVLLKIGRTDRGRKAAVSHTAAMAGSYVTFRAACEQNGIVLVETIRELVDVTRGFAAGRRAGGNRLVIVSSSGGSGALMADVTEDAGLELPEPSATLRDRLAGHLPSFGSASNPVDITGNLVNDLRPTAAVLDEICATDEFDLVAYSTVARTLPEAHREMLLEAKAGTGKPFFAVAHQPDVLAAMAGRGLTCFADGAAMVRVLGRLVEAESARRFLDLTDAPEPGEPTLTGPVRGLSETDATRLVARYGIAVPRETAVTDAPSAAAATDALAGPVVLKIDAPWLPHKSDVGGVVLGVRGGDEAAAAYRRLAEVAERNRPSEDAGYRVLVAEQVPSGVELMLGVTRDPVHGPVVTLAAGGVTTEIMGESQTSVVPFNRARAEAMVDRLWNGRLVRHPRGLTAAARVSLVEAILAVQRLAASEPWVSEVDMNPLIATADRVIAVDALVVLGQEVAS